MEKQIEKILIYIGAGSVITIALGSLIINLSLSQFQLSDYNLLQPHAIAVGLAFLAWLTGHLFYLFLFVNLEDFKSNSRKKMVGIALIKFLVLLSCLFVLLGGVEYINDPVWTFRAFSWKIDFGRITMFLPIVGSSLFFMFYIDWVGEKKNIIYRLIFIIFIISIVAAFVNALIYYNSPLYSDLFCFEANVFGIFLFSSIGIIERRRGLGPLYKGNWFSPSNPSEKTNGFTLTFVVFILLIGLIGLIISYTKYIYPHVPQSIGGGRLEEIRYRTDKEVVIGKKFYETSESVFLLNGDSIRKIDWSEIKKVLPAKKQKSINDSVRIPFISK